MCLLWTDCFDIGVTGLRAHIALMLELQNHLHLQIVDIAIDIFPSIETAFPYPARQYTKNWPDGWDTSDDEGDVAFQPENAISVMFRVVFQAVLRSPDKEIRNVI